MHQDGLKKLALGEAYELKLARLLQKKGISCIPTAQAEYKRPPKMFGGNKKEYPALDIIVFNKPYNLIEVKTKNRIINHEGIKESGIDLESYNIYKEIQEELKVKILLVIIHNEECPEYYQGVYGILLNNLIKNHREWNGCIDGTTKKVHEPMILAPINKYVKMTTLEELNA